MADQAFHPQTQTSIPLSPTSQPAPSPTPLPPSSSINHSVSTLPSLTNISNLISIRILTLEDAYYNNHKRLDHSDTCLDTPMSHDEHSLLDFLGLAVAKMSYLVYALGEGIVGQVAISGKHQWVFADKPALNIRFSSETVVVRPIAPCGVIQLGSLNKVSEGIKLVEHIKNVLYLLQKSSLEFISTRLDYTRTRQTAQYSKSTKNYGQEILSDAPHKLERSISSGTADTLSHSSRGIYNILSPNTFPLLGADHRVESQASAPGTINMEQQKQMKLHHEKKCVDESTNSMNMISSECSDSSAANNFPSEVSWLDYPSSPLDLYSSYWSGFNFDGVSLSYPQQEEQNLPEQLEMQFQKGFEQISESQTEVSCVDTLDCLRFSACSELHEALRPTFKKVKRPCAWNESEIVQATHIQPPEGFFSDHFATKYETEQLLEAVVANAHPSFSKVISECSLRKSAESILTTEKTPRFRRQFDRGGRQAHGSVVQ